MNIRLLSALLLSMAFHTAAPAQEVRVVTRVVTDTVRAWSVWRSDGFSMNHPSTWTVDPAAGGDTVVVVRKLKDAPPAGRTSVALAVRRMEGEIPTLDRRLKALKAKNVEMLPADEPGAPDLKREEFKYDVNGVQMHQVDEVLEASGGLYLLSYAAPESTFGEYRFLAEAMINSFSAPAGR